MKWFEKWRHTNRTVCLVDYEYWYYSYLSHYHIKPDPEALKNELEKKHQLSDLYFFANFSPAGIHQELEKLNQITGTVVDTGQMPHPKYLSTFVLLDHLYRLAIEQKDIKTFILFIGNECFCPVIDYLTHKLQKNVLVYVVKDAADDGLLNSGVGIEYLPATEELFHRYYEMIVEDLTYVSTKVDIVPTFKGVASTVSKRYQVPETEISAALVRMLDQGYLYQKEAPVAFNRRLPALYANWELLIRDGLVSDF